MSVQLLPTQTWAAAVASKSSGLSSTTRHVALTLALWMSEKGTTVHPGADALADDTGLSVRCVREHLGLLVDRGWLVLVHRGGQKGERRVANAYQAAIPPDSLPFDGAPSCTGDAGSPVTQSAGPMQETAPTGDPHRATPAPGSPRSSTRKTSNQNPLRPASPNAGKRPIDPCWDATLTACGLTAQGCTASERGAWNKAVADLKRAGADPATIAERAAAFRRRWPNVSLTPAALARRWSECIAAPSSPAGEAFEPDLEPRLIQARAAVAELPPDVRSAFGYDLLLQAALDALEQTPDEPTWKIAMAAQFRAEQARPFDAGAMP